MQLNKKFYLKEAGRIISLLKKDFVMENGAFFLERSGTNIFSRHIFPDFGDFAPFFLYFGEGKFVDEQVSIFKGILKNGVLVSEFPSFGIKNLAKSYEYTDLLFGLIDYYAFKKDKESFDLLLNTADSAAGIFNFGGGTSSFYHTGLRARVPVFDTRDATFMEIFADLHKLVPDKKYLDFALNIYERLIKTDLYKKHGLFPTWDANFFVKTVLDPKGNKFNAAQIHKNNSNALFALLSLYKETKSESVLKTIFTVINNLKNKATAGGGGVLEIYRPGRPSEQTSLSSSFSVLDFLCDFYHFQKRKEDLDYAENIAKYWMARQGKTGLFPEFGGGKISFFDAETDMCVALYKLGELTGNQSYRAAADKCLNGIIEFHGKNDYVLGVDVGSGAVVNNAQRTKFIALFLKLLILKIETAGGEPIYGNGKLLDLLKDR